MITIEEFQKIVNQGLQPVGDYFKMPANLRLLLNAVGLAGETGEIANKIKKHAWYAPQSDLKSYVTAELGDVFCHAVQLATELEINLDDIMEGFLEKQKLRAYCTGCGHDLNQISHGDICPYRVPETNSDGDTSND